MSRLLRLPMVIAIVLCGAVGLTSDPALAKKSASEAASAQKQNKKQSASKDCRKTPIPPFMRNPRFMNRGFFKKKC